MEHQFIVTAFVAVAAFASFGAYAAPISKDITVTAIVPHVFSMTKDDNTDLSNHIVEIEESDGRLKSQPIPVHVNSNGLVGMKVTADPNPELTHGEDAAQKMPLRVAIGDQDLTAPKGHEVNANEFFKSGKVVPKKLDLTIAPTETDASKHAAGVYTGNVKVNVSPAAD